MLLRKQIYRFFILLLGMVACVYVAEAADTRIGIVNTSKLLKEAPQAEAARKKLESEFSLLLSSTSEKDKNKEDKKENSSPGEDAPF